MEQKECQFNIDQMLVTEQSFGNTAQEFHKEKVSNHGNDSLPGEEAANIAGPYYNEAAADVVKTSEERSPLFKTEDKRQG